VTPTEPYLVLSTILFCLGALAVLTRRTAVMILLGIELMLNAVNLSFVALARHFGDLSGQTVVFLILTIAAAEVAVGLGLIVAIFRRRASADVDDLHALRG
jgi:NADH-quinone oxidoreductase subunit K